MAKCSNCGAELNAGVKFCEECGTPVPQTKTCPKCGAELKPEAKFCGECGYSFAAKSAPSAKAGVSVGDKNVIAGDVVGESYKITGGATIVKNEDETKKMVRCHVCGRNMPITEAITCVKCGEHTCESCMDMRVKSCKTCVESATREQENVYRQAVVRTLEDGVITLAERRELKALQKQLGLTDARIEEIENQVRADQGRKQVEAPALSSFEKITLERAIETFYGVGDTAAAFAAVEPIYGRHPEDEQVVSFYAAVLAAKDPEAARSFVDGLHADILGVKLAGIDATLAENDLNDAEIRLDSVARIWPDSVLVKCRRIAFLLAMNEQLDEKSFLGQANALALDLSEGETKLEKSFVERTIRRVMKATGETVEDLSDEDCRARGLYPFLSRGDMTSLSPVVQTLIDNEAAADDWSDKESSSSNNTYSVVLKVAAENKGPMLRDLVSITGKRLWPDISEMVENLPAVVVSGLDEDEASKYALALILDGAEAAVVADGSKIVEEEEGVDEEIDEENVEEISDDEPSPSARCSILLKSVGSDRNAVIREMRLLFNCTFGEGKSIVEKAPVHLQQDIAREEAERIAAILRKAGATIELVDC